MDENASVIVRIEGEPFLSRAKAYFDEFEKALGAWRAFAGKVGATSLSDPLGALGFDGEPPKGWIAKTRNGRSRPKKGSPMEAEIAALPPQPSSFDVFGDAVLYDLCYEASDGSVKGSGAIGFFIHGPPIGRVDGVIMARIPHAGRAAAAHLARHPTHVIGFAAADWSIPEGLVEISQAEMEFMYAKAKLEREKAAAA